MVIFEILIVKLVHKKKTTKQDEFPNVMVQDTNGIIFKDQIQDMIASNRRSNIQLGDRNFYTQTVSSTFYRDTSFDPKGKSPNGKEISESVQAKQE